MASGSSPTPQKASTKGKKAQGPQIGPQPMIVEGSPSYAQVRASDKRFVRQNNFIIAYLMQINHKLDYIFSNVKMNTETLVAQQAISKNLEQEQMLVPEDSIMFKNSDDTYNLRFSSYKKKQAKNDDETSTSGLEKFLG